MRSIIALKSVARDIQGAAEWYSAPSLHTDPQSHRRDTAIRAAYKFRQQGMPYKKIAQLLGMHHADTMFSVKDIKKEINTRYHLYVSRCTAYANWRQSDVDWLASITNSDLSILYSLDLSEVANA